ncbi:hypothetical protein V6N13_038308 [Hibiscus sabdariffa]
MVWQTVCENISWVVGNGQSVDFWHDSWLSDVGPLIEYTSTAPASSIYPTMVSDLVAVDGEWRWGDLQHVLPMHILLRLAAVKCPKISFRDDKIGWVGSKDRSYQLLALTVRAGQSQKLVIPVSNQTASSSSARAGMWNAPPL